jgi:hypothetical protein
LAAPVAPNSDEVVACPACTKPDFINEQTGEVPGREKK